MITMSKKLKKYDVSIEMRFSHKFNVNSKGKIDAKRVAFDRMNRTICKKKNEFNIIVEEV